MIRGPEKTPYEDGLFFFDFQLSAEYPKAPPLCHYISYCSDRLNPNLYEDGKVCVSLLGTWSGKGTEVWTLHSNLLQVIVSIQGKFKGSAQLGVTSCTQTCCSGLTRTSGTLRV
jgi:ubiquitin-conjugating enzyme E2 O